MAALAAEVVLHSGHGQPPPVKRLLRLRNKRRRLVFAEAVQPGVVADGAVAELEGAQTHFWRLLLAVSSSCQKKRVKVQIGRVSTVWAGFGWLSQQSRRRRRTNLALSANKILF